VTVHLHRDFTDPKFTRDLLVHHACSHESHHFLLARAERIEVATQIVRGHFAVSPLAIAVKRNSNSIQKILLANGLGKELNRASFHSSNGHRDITVARDKNDWNIDLNFGLKFEPAQSRQSNIQNEAPHLIRYLAPKEFPYRSEGLTLQANRFKEGS
jgi:hypothetical protein